jgi:phospholipase/lecithinase/hemolysin
MRQFTRWSWAVSLAMLTAWGLSGCGGGNDSLPPKASISKVYVMGDSLADVGTFGGVKFTVQDPVNPQNSLVWSQLIANSFGLNGSAQCNFFAFTGTTFAANSTAGCTNYAIGGGRVRVKDADGGNNNPQTVGTQMAMRALAGTYTANDLVLIDGGGNDAADLVTAFLTLSAAAGTSGEAAALTAYQDLLAQQLSSATISAALGQSNGTVTVAGLYMQTLANTFYDAVTTSVLNSGAKHVGILNIPDITITPRFQAVLSSLSPAQSAQVQTMIRAWITAFNDQLKTRIGTDPRVALVDFYKDFQDEVANPVNYSLTNVTTPVCTVTMGALDKFPCLSTALDAAPPAGKTAGWWKSYAFADGFHPTPYGHQLLAASVSRALARAGWL